MTTSLKQPEVTSTGRGAPTVLVSVQDSVATLTLNRPAALNSFTAAMHAELQAALEAAAHDSLVRCVVLTAVGRGFCTGQDLSDLAEGSDLGQWLSRYYHPLIETLRRMPVPTLAAVNGVAAGAGAAIALMCDMVIATASANFTFPFARIGLVPDSGLAWFLPRHIGWARAMALFMLGDKVSAAEAQAFGLIWRAVEDNSFEEVVRATAARLASSSTAAIVATRSLMDRAQEKTLTASMYDEVDLQRARGQSPDYREGMSAFLAKSRSRTVGR